MKRLLKNDVVCVSGKFVYYSQEEVENLVVKHGGEISVSITKKTTMLVIGNKASSTKLKKAEELGIRIVDESEFFQMVNEIKGKTVFTTSPSTPNVDHSIRFEIRRHPLDEWNLEPLTKEQISDYVEDVDCVVDYRGTP